MNLPEWVESVTGLIGKLTAQPIRVSKNAFDMAAYLGYSFTAAAFSLIDDGIARPFSELAESKLQKIKSIDIAEAAEAHNKALRTKAEADSLSADVAVKEARARAIDTKADIERMEAERRLVEERRREAEARLAAATARLRLQGGGLYLDPPPKPGLEPDAM